MVGCCDLGEVRTLVTNSRSLRWHICLRRKRIILIEVSPKHRRPSTQYPSQESHLPADFEPDATQPDQPPRPFNRDFPHTPTLSALNSTRVGNFGRQAQSVYLLDELFRATSASTSYRAKLERLRKLDTEIQAIMALMMGEQGFRCAAVATAIRYSSHSHQPHPQCVTQINAEKIPLPPPSRDSQPIHKLGRGL